MILLNTTEPYDPDDLCPPRNDACATKGRSTGQCGMVVDLRWDVVAVQTMAGQHSIFGNDDMLIGL